jgi:hypothetical protein
MTESLCNRRVDILPSVVHCVCLQRQRKTLQLCLAGALLLTPFEARAISWSMPEADEPGGSAGGAAGGALRALSLRLLARWRLDAGDAGVRLSTPLYDLKSRKAGTAAAGCADRTCSRGRAVALDGAVARVIQSTRDLR